jgi:hypothetical protein
MGADAVVAGSEDDPAMSGKDEMVWRAALERKGADWVTHELQKRRGQPWDAILEVVFVEPHPTREFCQRWCAEQENRGFSMSPTTIGIIAATVLVVVFLTMAVSSFEKPQQQPSSELSSGPAALGHASTLGDNTAAS